ncbi:MAG TPA: 50S ribosomal protein L9 [Verrucomicrobiae bacterium]|nr:50S ribosomal protein L9 [Verrucomicrobiae bacterium]
MHTEIILKAKVEGLGAEADMVKVRPGYARNYLIPKGLAMPATAAFKHQVEKLKQARAEREARELNEANTLATRINRMTLTFQMAAGGEGERVFGSVTAHDIVDRLAKENVHIDRKKLKLPHPIKTTGEHEIEINLHPDVKATLRVVLEIKRAEGEEAEHEAKGRKVAKRPRKGEALEEKGKEKEKEKKAKDSGKAPAKGGKSGKAKGH